MQLNLLKNHSNNELHTSTSSNTVSFKKLNESNFSNNSLIALEKVVKKSISSVELKKQYPKNNQENKYKNTQNYCFNITSKFFNSRNTLYLDKLNDEICSNKFYRTQNAFSPKKKKEEQSSKEKPKERIFQKDNQNSNLNSNNNNHEATLQINSKTNSPL